MRVRWKAVAGASGYMILYAPLTEEDASDEKEVRSVLVCNESKCEAKNELRDAEQAAPCWAPALIQNNVSSDFFPSHNIPHRPALNSDPSKFSTLSF